MMKGIRCFIMMLLMALPVSSGFAQENGESLEKLASDINSKCPLAYDEATVLAAVEYGNGELVFYIVTDDTYASFKKLKESPDIMKSSVKAMLSAGDMEMKELMSVVVKEGACLRYNIEGLHSGETLAVTFGAEELRDIIRSDEPSSPDDRLAALIEATNAQFPMEMGMGMTVERIRADATAVYYDVSVDDKSLSVEQIIENAAVVKMNMIKNFSSVSGPARKFVEVVRESGRALAYNYISSKTGKSFILSLSLADIDRILGN